MDLSLVIVNYKTKKITADCINSVLKYTKNLKYEIAVIDNASSDGSLKYLNDKYKKHEFIKFIGNKKNLGFAKANNQGARKTSGKYILFLNSDTLVTDNVLRKMLTWMEENTGVAVSSCALKNRDGSLQGSGGYFPILYRVFNWMFFIEDIPYLDILIKPFHPVHAKSFIYKGLKKFEKTHYQDWVTGAFFLVRRAIFEKAGMFDEDYFMYTEEVDLCYRIKKMGFSVCYLADEKIIHLGGASSNREFPVISEYKGIKLFYKKNMPYWQFPFVRIFLKCGALLRAFIFGISEGREAFKVYVKAFKIA